MSIALRVPGLAAIAPLASLVVLATACTSGTGPAELAASPDPVAASESEASVAPATAASGLAGGAGTVEELIGEAFAAITARDADRLNALRVTREEYTRLLFPEFDIAARNEGLGADIHWALLDAQSQKGARALVQDFADGRLRYESHEFSGVEVYASYRLHRRTVVRAKTAAGTDERLSGFGSIVEMDGRFKFLSFRD